MSKQRLLVKFYYIKGKSEIFVLVRDNEAAQWRHPDDLLTSPAIAESLTKAVNLGLTTGEIAPPSAAFDLLSIAFELLPSNAMGIM